MLKARGRTVVMADRPLVMGILNLNDDSFSDSGFPSLQEALRRAREMVEQGVDIIDVGAESARTNRAPISEDEELRRLMPFLEELQRWFLDGYLTPPFEGAQQVFPPLISVNTWRGEVCRVIAESGAADILNDMSGLRTAANAEICARHGVALLIMHIEGEPKVAHQGIDAGESEIAGVVKNFLRDRLQTACSAGLAEEQVILDPGFGFAKTPAQDLALLRNIDDLRALGRPVLMPVSRKGFIGHILNQPQADRRDAGTMAVVAHFAEKPGLIFRVHDVLATRHVVEAVRHAAGAID